MGDYSSGISAFPLPVSQEAWGMLMVEERLADGEAGLHSFCPPYSV